MSKYVAFLDILGFKKKLQQLGQDAAKQYISAFSATAYHEWEQLQPKLVEGYIVSDSFIIYSRDASRAALTELLTIIDQICKKEFSENKILIRGAIAKGEFDRMPAVELSNLSKGLMVGQAYVDAYTMENAAKVAGILLTEEVYSDVGELDGRFECSEEKTSGASNYIMRYLDYEYLTQIENMRIYVELAASSNWLPHYYNTLYFAIKAEKNSNKATTLFESILASIGDPSEYWQEIDRFIKNAFDKDVMPGFQKRFLKYIREQIVLRNSGRETVKTRPSSRERVLKFIEERGNLTISQISSTLDMARPTTARIVRNLTEEGLIAETLAEIPTGSDAKHPIRTYSAKE